MKAMFNTPREFPVIPHNYIKTSTVLQEKDVDLASIPLGELLPKLQEAAKSLKQVSFDSSNKCSFSKILAQSQQQYEPDEGELVFLDDDEDVGTNTPMDAPVKNTLQDLQVIGLNSKTSLRDEF